MNRLKKGQLVKVPKQATTVSMISMIISQLELITKETFYSSQICICQVIAFLITIDFLLIFNYAN
jgi:hypothetical protein